MFNLVVAGNGEKWESKPYRMTRSRFGEYSEFSAETFDLNKPETLQELQGTPILLMYEIGANGDNTGVVRYGKLSEISLDRSDIVFDLDLHSEHGYLTRVDVAERSQELGIDTFEHSRTHWAIKNRTIPADLLSRGSREIPKRDARIVWQELKEETKNARRAELKKELKAFPASIEKANAYAYHNYLDVDCYEALSNSDLTQKERRQILSICLADGKLEALKSEKPFSLAWALHRFRSPMEEPLFAEVLSICESELKKVLSNRDSSQPIAENDLKTVFQCVRNRDLALCARTILSPLLTSYAESQNANGSWSSESGDCPRITAMLTVILQRLRNVSTIVRQRILV